MATRSWIGVVGMMTFTASSVVAAQALAISSSPIMFGSVAAGSTSTQVVTISNLGRADEITFKINVGGAAGSYSRAGGTCPTNFPAILPAGTYCTVAVQFAAPTALGSYTGFLDILASTANSTTAITATTVASGVPPTPSVTTLDFGLAANGVEFSAQSVTFTNTTANTVAVEGLFGSPAQISLGPLISASTYFTEIGSCVVDLRRSGFPIYTGPDFSPISSLAPGASCTLGVRPSWYLKTAGAYNTTLTLATSAGNTTVNLRAAIGTANYPIVAEPATLSLTRANANLATSTGTVTVSNPAPVAATIVGIVVPAPFQRAGGTCPSTFPAPLAVGASCTMTIIVPSGAAASPIGDFTAYAPIFADTGNLSVKLTLETGASNGDTDNDGIPDAVEIAEGRNPGVKDNQIFAGQHSNANRWFAMQQYRDFLSREAEATGLAGWTSRLSSNSMSREAVIQGFFGSPEFQSGVPSVVRLYLGFFNRIPDSAGLKGWVEAVRGGTPIATVASSFARSQEFSLTYGALTDAQFVTLVYRNVLGRAPDTAGFNGWIARLNSGVSRGDVMVGFTESAEYQLQTAPNVFVIMMYEGMLRRAAEPAGYQYWVDYINSGNDALEITRGFLYSQEYRSRFLP